MKFVMSVGQLCVVIINKVENIMKSCFWNVSAGH